MPRALFKCPLFRGLPVSPKPAFCHSYIHPTDLPPLFCPPTEATAAPFSSPLCPQCPRESLAEARGSASSNDALKTSPAWMERRPGRQRLSTPPAVASGLGPQPPGRPAVLARSRRPVTRARLGPLSGCSEAPMQVKGGWVGDHLVKHPSFPGRHTRRAE